MKESKRNTENKNLIFYTVVIVVTVAVTIVFYLLSYGRSVPGGPKKGEYNLVVITRLDSGTVTQLSKDTDEKDSAAGKGYMRFENAANVISLIRVDFFKAKEIENPMLEFVFYLKDGTKKTFVIGENAVSVDGVRYKTHRRTETDLFDSLIKNIYFGEDMSLPISEHH
jgi:hypothetical protein